jgi:tripartite-type tricarboxylate transporter receptor subunit TctC
MSNIRQVLTLAFSLTILFPAAVLAQPYPSKAIRMIVIFPPGGGTDFMARVVAHKLSERLGQQVIVDNRGGANGITGLQVLMQQPADGYTICAATAGPLAVNPHMYKNLPYDPLRDFSIIGWTVDFPLLLLTHPSLPVKTAGELIALAKKRPNELSMGSSGTGNSDHLALELFRSMAKIQFVHVPYKGSGPSTVALVGGEVPMMFSSIPPTLGHIRAGKLRALGVGNLQRLPNLPEFPPIAETGLPGFEAYSWGGLIAPRGVPKDIIDKLNRELNEALKSKDVVDKLLEAGTVPRPNSPDNFTAHIKAEIKKWGDVVKTANIKAE